MYTDKLIKKTALTVIGGAALTLAALFAAAPLHAQTQTQTVKLSEKTLTVGKAFKEIETQAGYRFAYNSRALDIHREVELPSTVMDVQQLLDEVLEGTGLSAVINDRHIVIVQPESKEDRQMAIFDITNAGALPEEKKPSRIPDMDALEETFLQKQRLPRIALKINLLTAATTSLNLAVEARLSNRLTLDLPVSYNPWTFGENKKLKHISVQPELRYWIHEPFNGHFLGVHLHYALFNVGGLDLPLGQLPSLASRRYQGHAYGAGVSYGYHWMLSNSFSLEATLGLGYARIDYEEYECARCGDYIGRGSRDYFGITRLGISLVWIIK